MKIDICKCLILITGSFMMFSACKGDKDELSPTKEYCWRCDIVQTTSAPSMPDLNYEGVSHTEVCNTTVDGIRAYENNGTSTNTGSSNGVNITVSVKTTCTRK